MVENLRYHRPHEGPPGDGEGSQGRNLAAMIGSVGKVVMDVLPTGVIVFDEDLQTVYANARARTLVDLDDLTNASSSSQTEPALAQGLEEKIKRVISSGKPYAQGDTRYCFKGKPELLRFAAWPVVAPPDLNTIGCVLTIEDTSDIANMQKQLADADRLAALGSLASRVAHELNNPLDGILRYVNLAMRIVEQQGLEKPCEYLTQCRQGLMRMVQIVSELLEFSRRTYASMETAGVEKIAEEALRAMESRAEAKAVTIKRNYGQVSVEVRSGNLFQVFCNIVKNALDAMPDGGELNVSTSVIGEMVAVRFRDTGSGFSPSNAEAIFEPFFTTKDKGDGTGLGLAICRDIIERQNGRITAENAPDRGSVFTVWLPARTGLKRDF